MELKEYIKEIKVGNIPVKHNVFLAPMAGVTDLPFRYICNKYGGVVYSPTEMVSTRGLVYKDKKTHKIMDMHENENPKVIQMLLGHKDVTTTIRTYNSVDRSYFRQATDKLDAKFSS